ncbi:hypothetical protein [Cellvibrio sp. QJXJ]|uniref:hypothetical protein n=1 Tax=Cellvibrio sp. QJXJ TaxID=2964606 RepID=UPI0021C4A83A|nr:hypothetical protein [Cellvibrio sp. QJXJ]UUA75189.1 hypothetical protein NNX04_22285 [Cellvibrio sp. QJXJ]
MKLQLIGHWSKPLAADKHNSLIIQAVKRFDGCCAYCAVKMPMTVTHPHGGLSVCLKDNEVPLELDNLLPLCAFCVNFNDINNLKGSGSFVELPWITQSDLTNILRVIYCVQTSSDPFVKSSYIYQGSSAILEELGRAPKQWDDFYFDGSVEKVIEAYDSAFGFFDKRSSSEVLYVDRLRFFFLPDKFKAAIDFWRPTIEAQIIKGFGQ